MPWGARDLRAHRNIMSQSIYKTVLGVSLLAALSFSPLHAQSVSSTTTATTTTAGTISEVAPDALLIRTETSATPVRYGFSSSTTYVDETGAPVSREVVRSGVPVTVHYIRDGERLIADRVIVRRQTTTATAPTVIERSTNTTVTQPPVVVEKKVPVVVEKKVPVVVEKKVPVVVEKPVIVEKRVPAPTVEEKTTTTTTTTTDR